MIISTQPTQKGGRINIYLDGEYAFTLDGDIWYSCPYSDGYDINEQELASLKMLVGSRLAYSQALRILTLRANSEKELRDKLSQKHSENAIDYAVERCKELGFINDEEFAERYARELYEKKHFGINRIMQELHRKGINREICENICETLDFNPVMSIINVIESKYRNCLDDEKGRRRTVAGLQRLGYGYSDIKKAMARFTNGDDEYFE